MSTNNEEDPDVNSIKWLTAMIPVASMAAAAAAAGPVNPADLGKDGYVDSNGVKIHYVMAGSGPLCVMIHGFPDFWYTCARRDARAGQALSSRGHRSARLQPQRQTRRSR